MHTYNTKKLIIIIIEYVWVWYRDIGLCENNSYEKTINLEQIIMYEWSRLILLMFKRITDVKITS